MNIRTVTAAAAVAVIATTTAASATQQHFGHHQVREGVPTGVPRFALTSPDLRDGWFPASAVADSSGCSGGNVAPRLSWSGAPAKTRGYAITMFDRDAPTGSGFWHWVVGNVPATATSLPASPQTFPNDAGFAGYLGPCPPAGDRPHRYELTVLALDTAAPGLSASASPAVAAFTLHTHVVGYARITVKAVRH